MKRNLKLKLAILANLWSVVSRSDPHIPNHIHPTVSGNEDFNIFKAPYVIFDISNAPEIVKRIHVWHSSGIEIAILPHPWNRGSEFFTQYRRAKMCENTHTSVQAWVDSNVGVRADDQMLATAISMTYKMFLLLWMYWIYKYVL